MTVPPKKSPRSNRGHRRGHIKVAPVTLFACPKCKQTIPPHQACPNCGYYRGRDVLKLEAKLTKKEKKKAEKERKKKEEEEEYEHDKEKEVS
ncbi:MAG: 50S ribosomal protein L32 [Patescibacteria group bacterium]